MGYDIKFINIIFDNIRIYYIFKCTNIFIYFFPIVLSTQIYPLPKSA